MERTKSNNNSFSAKKFTSYDFGWLGSDKKEIKGLFKKYTNWTETERNLANETVKRHIAV